MRAGFGEWAHRTDPLPATPEPALGALAPTRSDLDEGLVSTFKRKLLDEVDLHELGRLDPGQRRIRLERVVAHLVSTEGVILTTRERNALIRRVVDESIGLGVLEPLLADETVSEIMINGPDTIYVERFGQVERVSASFASEEQLRQTIDRIVSTVNRRVDESSPMVDARLPADERMPRGARVHVVLPPLVLNGPTVTIRLFPKSYGLDELLNRGSLDEPTAELLAACVRARLNIIVSGGTSSGKTTMLNALSAFIQGRQRIITIEDAAELSLVQDHVVRLETRPANVEGHGQVTIRDLVRNALRMRPDRIIVGEVRGGEALDMLQAMNTGHEGSLATVHANTTVDALIRLETLASMSDVEVPFHALRDQVNNAVDLVIQLLRGSDGTRRVVEVGWVSSRHREDFAVQPLMRWDPEIPNASGPPGRFVRYPIPQPILDKLRIAGEPIGLSAVPLSVAPGPGTAPAAPACRWACRLGPTGGAMIILVILLGVLAAAIFFVIGAGHLGGAMARRRSLVAGVISDELGEQTRFLQWDRAFRRTGPGRWVESQLLLAGEERRAPLLVALIAVGGGLAIGWVLAVGLAPIFGLLGIAAVVVGVKAYLARAKDRRNEQFIAQMPELARVLSNATSAGLSIASAVSIAASELSEPAGPELARVASRMRFGDSLDTAMKGLENRLPSREVTVLISTLLVSARSGGSLVSALRDIADTLEARRETRREVRTTLAQSTSTGYLVIGMGFALLFVLNLIQPGTVQAMTDSWIGRAALVVGSSLFVGGFLLIRRMTRYDG